MQPVTIHALCEGGGMERNDLTQTGMDDRPRHRRPQPARAMADEDLPLDHHIEELLQAMSDLAGMQTAHPTGS
jgi:hypothetical protein